MLCQITAVWHTAIYIVCCLLFCITGVLDLPLPIRHV